MKIETKITERDKKLLVFLAVFLLAVGFLVVIILPSLDEASALQEEIAASEQSKKEMELKIAALPNLKQQKEEQQEEWGKISSVLYQRMATQDIDKIVTEEVLKQGLTTKSLKITLNQEPASLKKYLADETEEVPAAETTEESGEAEGESQEAASQEEENFGIYTASVNLSVEGSRKKIRTLTDRFADDYAAVRVVSMQYDTREVIDDAGIVQAVNTTLDLNLEFYMCDK